MGDAIAQVVIIGCALVSQMLIPSKLAGRRRIGFSVALLAQPAWFYTTYSNGQWGLFVMSIWYALNFVRGVRNNWRAE